MAGIAALAVYACWLEPSSLRLTRYVLPVQDAPGLSGLKIAVISDLHAGSPYIDIAKIDAVTAMANAAKPDLILLTGDYVMSDVLGGHHMPIDVIAAHLKALHAPLGVYAIMGNNDILESVARISASLRRAGIGVLENAHAAIPTAHGTLYLAGMGDLYTGGADPDAALAGIPRDARGICFTHSPDLFPSLPRICALTVAGHTHGGQVNLPWLGRLIVPSSFGQRYAAGLVQEDSQTLFVSTGIGTSIVPVRFRVPPEVSLLELR